MFYERSIFGPSRRVHSSLKTRFSVREIVLESQLRSPASFSAGRLILRGAGVVVAFLFLQISPPSPAPFCALAQTL